MLSFSQEAETLTSLIYHRPSGEYSSFQFTFQYSQCPGFDTTTKISLILLKLRLFKVQSEISHNILRHSSLLPLLAGIDPYRQGNRERGKGKPVSTFLISSSEKLMLFRFNSFPTHCRDKIIELSHLCTDLYSDGQHEQDCKTSFPAIISSAFT